MTSPVMWRTLRTILAGTLAMLLLIGPGSLPGAEPKGGKFVLAWGKKGDKPGEFYSPISIAIDRRDVVYVTDLNNARLQRFTTEGEYLGGFDLPLDKPPRKSCIVGGMAVDDDGNAYLSLMVQDKVQVYTESGQLLREWGKRGAGGRGVPPAGRHRPGARRDRLRRGPGQPSHPDVRHGGEVPGQVGRARLRAGPVRRQRAEGLALRRAALPGDGTARAGSTPRRGRSAGCSSSPPRGSRCMPGATRASQPGGFGALKTGFSKQTFGPIGVFVDGKDRVWVSSLNDRVQALHDRRRVPVRARGHGRRPRPIRQAPRDGGR